MRWLSGICALFIGMSVSGCALIEAEKDNRGGFLDQTADRLWMKADSKKMRALRALAIEASLARIAMIAPKSAPDRALLARRIGETTKRADVVRQCAFLQLPIPGRRSDEPCFFFDSVMVDYENALFDLALVSLPIEDAKNLITRVSGGIASISVNPMELVQTLVDVGREAFRYGRVVGAIYRDTMELEVQVWLASPGLEQQTAALRAVYAVGNDNIPAWRGEIATLRAGGLEPIPEPRFMAEIYYILAYICKQIVSETDPAYKECSQPDLSKNLPVVSDVSLFRSVTRSAALDVNRPDGVNRSGRTSTPTPPPPPVTKIVGAITNIEKNITLDRGKAFQAILCVAATGDFGNTNSPTRNQLQLFNTAYLVPTNGTAPTSPPTASGTIANLGDLDHLQDALGKFSTCDKAGLRNGYEVGQFTRNGSDTMRNYLAAALKKAVPSEQPPPALTAQTGAPTDALVFRKAIRDLRAKFMLRDSDEIDRDFYEKLIDFIKR